MSRKETIYSAGCTTCHANGQRGYCASLRCYCAHPDCPAHASYRPPTTEPAKKRTKK